MLVFRRKRAPPGPTQVPCPVPLAALRTPPDHTSCIATYAGRRRDQTEDETPRFRNRLSGALARLRRAVALVRGARSLATDAPRSRIRARDPFGRDFPYWGSSALAGGGAARRRRSLSGLCMKHAVELGVAAEPGVERGGECGSAASIAVEGHEALESPLVPKASDRDAGLVFEDAAEVRRA